MNSKSKINFEGNLGHKFGYCKNSTEKPSKFILLLFRIHFTFEQGNSAISATSAVKKVKLIPLRNVLNGRDLKGSSKIEL